jgi:SAM-dependent methyltransferase
MNLPVRKNFDVLNDLISLRDKDVVDVGCGDGGLVRRLSREGARVIGVECGAQALEAARAAQPVGDERYAEGVGQALPLPALSADVIIYANSLHHVPVESMSDALTDAARVLRADGLLYVQEPLADGTYFNLMKPIDDETEIRAAAQSVLGTAAHYGFTPVADVTYRIVQSFDDFEAFRRGMGAVDPSRLPVLDSMRSDLERRFSDLSVPDNGKSTFQQPMRVNVYQKTP